MLNKKERILLWSSNLWLLSDGMLGPLFAVFAERVGGNVLDISWAWAIYLMVTGIGVIIVGKLSDGIFSQEWMLVIGYALNTVFTFGYLFVATPVHLFLLQAGLGVSLALANPTWYALYDKHSTKRHEGWAWGLADGEGKIVMGFAIILGGFIVTYFSFSALFIIMGVIQVFATIYQARILKKT